MRVRTVVVLCVAAAACGSEPSPTGPTAQRVSLPSLVAGGGYVVFFRHAERDSAAITNDDLLEVDRTGACVPGSELTTRGESDSAAIGEAFRRRRIRIDRVYASPTCRTEQMARLAFGSHETTAGLAWPEIWTKEQQAELQHVLPDLLSRLPSNGGTTVLISHNGVLIPTRMGLDIMLEQAEAAIFRPEGSGNFEFIGKIAKTEW